MRTTRRAKLAAAVVAALAVPGIAMSTTSTAAAMPSGAARASHTPVSVVEQGSLSPDSYNATCFGYTGTFKDGSTILPVTWSSGTSECFGIAPDRTIWHAWPGSGGWKVMPGNGRADDTWAAYESSLGTRTVQVLVGSSALYCNSYTPGSGSGWGNWRNCT